MQWIKKARKSSLLPWLSLLTLVCAILLLKNFPFGTWYTGWDNLHPEFNFPLNFTRALTSVWQPNQGLGTYGGHGYAATLPHTFVLWLLSFIIPEQYLRSTFTFLMLFAGSFGVFFLVRQLLKDANEQIRNGSSFLSALFYIFNLATAQQFYIQLEPFTIHFAALPWLFWSVRRFLDNPAKKNLIIFTTITIFTSSMGFIPPLFIVYMLLLAIFLGSHYLYSLTLKTLQRVLTVFVITITLNLYWLLPVSYFTTTHSGTYLNAYNNISSTEDFILKNKKYGDVANVALLKGFIFEAIDATNNGDIFPIFAPWEQHLNIFVKTIGYALFGIILVGFLSCVKNVRKHPANLFLIVSFVLVFSLLATNTPPFSYISKVLQDIPVLKQAFRVAFTKFSIALALLYAILFTLGITQIIPVAKKFLTQKYMLVSLYPLVTFSLITFGWPFFNGKLLYDRTKLNIPQSYFQLFDFFKSQNPNERIANFPQGWNWGWSVYRWGYSGSGFLWYGIEQPIMDRAFDVWGKYNEDYFWQLEYAIYSENFPLIDKLVEKYHISFIILDKNIIPYANPRSHLYTEKVENYLNSNTKYEKTKTFSSKKVEIRDISVYKVSLNNQAGAEKSTVVAGNVKNIQPLYNYTHLDQAYLNQGDYFTDSQAPWSVYYPYRSLLTTRKLDELPFTIQDQSDRFDFVSTIPKEAERLTIQFDKQKAGILESIITVSQNDNAISVTTPKSPETEIYLSIQDPFFLNHKAFSCNTPPPDGKFEQVVIDTKYLRFHSKNSDNCYSIILNKLENKNAYLVKIESRHIKGKALEFAILNPDSRKPDIDVQLPNHTNFESDYLIIPPMKADGIGYNLNFNNISIGNEETENDLKNVEVYPIPYQFLNDIKFVNPNNSSLPSLLVFHQSFDPGWHAYTFSNIPNTLDKTLPFVRGKKLENHIIYNNWANAWTIPENTNKGNVVVFFLPQYLQYIGLFLIPTTLIASWLFHLGGGIRWHLGKNPHRVD
ncbi:MAG: hypothetical protein HYU80_02625 [Candidatus Blackburnbacteria bacterium]|nr:hypothetical protein [Candidatus Blackburnbacteria bacterium]